MISLVFISLVTVLAGDGWHTRMEVTEERLTKGQVPASGQGDEGPRGACHLPVQEKVAETVSLWEPDAVTPRREPGGEVPGPLPQRLPPSLPSLGPAFSGARPEVSGPGSLMTYLGVVVSWG